MSQVTTTEHTTMETTSPNQDVEVSLRAPAAGWLTVERVLYGLLILIAVAMRFYMLGVKPLNPSEAALAWRAWLDALAMHVPEPPLPNSPLFYTLQRFVFWLTDGGSDAWARFIPALAGTGMVALAWWFRSWLGRTGALLLALLLAIDPWLLAFSRHGDSTALTFFVGMLVLAALMALSRLGSSQWQEASTGRQPWLWVLALGSGLLLVSGPQAWNWLLVLLLFWALFLRPTDVNLWPGSAPERATLLGLFVGALLLGATGWLVHPQGLGYVSSSLTTWLAQFGSGSVHYPLQWSFLRLLVDQPLLVILGTAGLVYQWMEPRGGRTLEAVDGRRRWALFLTLWVAWGDVLLLLPGRDPGALLWLGFPLLLASAQMGESLLNYCLADLDWQEGALIVVSLSVLLVTSALWTALYLNQIGTAAFDGRAMFFYLILPVLCVFFVWWTGWRLTSQVVGLILLGVLFLVTVSSSWQMNLHSDSTRGGALFAVTADPNLRLLVADVEKLSALRAQDSREIPVAVETASTPDPLLGWYLREMAQLSWTPAPGELASAQSQLLVITPDAGSDTIELPAGYVGSRYPIRRIWLPTDLQGLNALMRWVFYRKVNEMPASESVVLWAKEE